MGRVNRQAMATYLYAVAKVRTVEHAAWLLERHVTSEVLGPTQPEIANFIRAAKEAHELEGAEC